MNLPEHEGHQFYELFAALLEHVNRKHRCASEFSGPSQYCSLPGIERLAVRNALYEHPECFDEFLADGGTACIADGPAIVPGWRDHRVSGRFFLMRSREILVKRIRELLPSPAADMPYLYRLGKGSSGTKQRCAS